MNDAAIKIEKRICGIHGEYEAQIFGELDGLDLSSNCPICEKERDAEREAEERRELESRRQSFIASCGTPRRYHGATLSNFLPKGNQREAVKAVKKYRANPDGNLIIAGTVGTGKTLLACSLLHTIGKGMYIRAIDISRRIRATYNNREEREEDVINLFVNTPILAIDEVGVQQGTDNEQTLITDIIDRRYGEMLPTVIVTNKTPEKLIEVFGERAWDRLESNATIIPMIGESLRGDGK